MMKASIITILFVLICMSVYSQEWVVEKNSLFTVYFTNADTGSKEGYVKVIGDGLHQAQVFFSDSFKKPFDVYLHPDRPSMETQWRKDWNMPGFKSECWMVASGVAHKLDLLSPRTWDHEACEHPVSDTTGTRQVIIHELFHVFHGQYNTSPDFGNTENIDWFVEGLATYASGQLNQKKLSEIKEIAAARTYPGTLNDFWKGRNRYALSGSVVYYIDKVYGREKLKSLLVFNKKDEILVALGISEKKLMEGWSEWLRVGGDNK